MAGETIGTLGNYLRSEREKKNISLEQVAYATRISLKMLSAIENDSHDRLPAQTFVRGYLQAYAKYVGLDVQDVLLRYQHHLATSPIGQKLGFKSSYVYVRERYQEKKRIVLIITACLTMLGFMAVGFGIKSHLHKRKELAADQNALPANTSLGAQLEVAAAPNISDNSPAKPAAAVAVAAVAAPTTEPAVVENKKYALVVKSLKDVWFRFQTDEDPVKDLTLKEGKELTLRANKVIKLFSGNLGALHGILNGEEIPSLLQEKRTLSAVLPFSEMKNYPPPLFPQFMKKPDAASDNAGTNSTQTSPDTNN